MKDWLKFTMFISIALFLLSLIMMSIASSINNIIWVMFFLGLGFFIIFLVGTRKQIKLFLTTRSFKYSSNIAVMSFAVVGIVVLINIIITRHDFRLDTTRHKIYSLSPQSQKIVTNLADDIFIKAFFRPGHEERVRELLSEYRYYSKHVKYEIIDPDVELGLVKKNEIDAYGVLVIQYKDRIDKIREVSEKAITNAIIKITRDEVKKIYFTTMHGERDIEDINPDGYNEARKGLENENYTVETIFLAEQEKVPADCDVLVIAGPKKELLGSEYSAIEAYLNKGGKLLVLLDPDQPDLSTLLSKWGINVGDNTIIDTSPIGQLTGVGPGSPLIANYEPSEITDDFNLMTVFKLARSVTVSTNPDSGLIVRSLAYTSDFPGSWAETDLSGEEIQFDEGKDVKGPISIAVSCEKVVIQEAGEHNIELSGPKKTRIVVFGDSDFASNSFYHFQGNGDLFLNAIAWLAEQGDVIAIRSKNPEDNRLSLSEQQSRIIFWVGVVFLPLAILMAGIVVYFNRR